MKGSKKLFSYIFLVLLLLFFSSAGGKKNTWIYLFEGSTLDGWKEANDLGRLEYCIDMIGECSLTSEDIWSPEFK